MRDSVTNHFPEMFFDNLLKNAFHLIAISFSIHKSSLIKVRNEVKLIKKLCCAQSGYEPGNCKCRRIHTCPHVPSEQSQYRLKALVVIMGSPIVMNHPPANKNTVIKVLSTVRGSMSPFIA